MSLLSSLYNHRRMAGTCKVEGGLTRLAACHGLVPRQAHVDLPFRVIANIGRGFKTGSRACCGSGLLRRWCKMVPSQC